MNVVQILRSEINIFSKKNIILEDQLANATNDEELHELKQQILQLNHLVQVQQEENETLETKLSAADDMKGWLTKQWEKTEKESLRFKEQLIASSKEKLYSKKILYDMEELLSFLSEQLKVRENDRGLRLAVKEEWSRFLMSSNVMKKWFEVEREVGMVTSWARKK